MKTRTYAILTLCILFLSLAAACGGKKADASVLTGTIDEIKSFMFVVTTEEGDPYAFSFEEAPEGLDTVQNGDKVKVTYTGEISVVDSFEGEVLSVEKVN